jgi:hypothetical protein
VFDLKLDDGMVPSSELPLPLEDTLSLVGSRASRDFSMPSSSITSRGTSPSLGLSYDSDHQSVASSFDMDNMTRPSLSRAESNVLDETITAEPSRHPHEYAEIEDLLINSGAERTIFVCFQPDVDQDLKPGRLTKTQFRIDLTFNAFGSTVQERKSIQCRARVCTSLIDVQPKELNFGDVDVGILKSMPLRIANQSDLSALVELRFSSKVSFVSTL